MKKIAYPSKVQQLAEPILPQQLVAAAESLPLYLDERSLARRWRLSPRTLQRWRREGTGPRHYRFGRTIRYRRDDILAFESGEGP